jgi:hypothetical protein
MSELTAEWEHLLWDMNGVPPPPPVPVRLRLYAAAHTARGLRILHRHGWGPAHRWLRDLHPGPQSGAYRSLGPPVAVRLARRELLASQLVLRMVEPNGLCLPRAFALATHLSALGLPAEVVVARRRISPKGQHGFHAWTEMYDEVLNDIPHIQGGYTILQRVTCRAAQQDCARGSSP